jgi:very-short-patch-repair endonuclease
MSELQRRVAKKCMRRLWKTRRKEMLAGTTKGYKASHNSDVWLKSVRTSRTTEERSSCMKRLWRKKRPKMMRGVLKGGPIGRKKTWSNPRMSGIISRAIKKKWRDKSFSEKVILENLSQGRIHPSKVQEETLRILERRTGLFLKLDYPVERYNLDIAYPNEKKEIELNGAYWHRLRTRSSRRRRNRILNRLGWRILRITITRKSLTESQIQRCVEFLS